MPLTLYTGRGTCDVAPSDQKTIAVSIFIYFAAVAPAITFDAVYSDVSASRVESGGKSQDPFAASIRLE
jgi:hypothetical protein